MRTLFIRLLVPLALLVFFTLPAHAQTVLTLAEQVGFSDPALDALEAAGVNTLGESVAFTAYGSPYRLLAVWSVLPASTDITPVNVTGGTALLYRMDATPTLVWQRDFAETGHAPFLTSEYLSFNAPPPGDWNGDGLTDFGVVANFAGTSWASYLLHIFTLAEDGTVTSPLTGTIPPGHIVTRAEQFNATSALMSVVDIRGEMLMNLPNCCGARVTRYFSWQGAAVEDISADLYYRYYEGIGNNLVYVTTTDFNPREGLPTAEELSARLLELMMVYEAIGARETGWTLAQALVAQAKAEGRLPEGTYVDTVFLPAMQTYAERGQPFLMPEYVDSDLSAIPRWY
jgi:hypothetical protein